MGTRFPNRFLFRFPTRTLGKLMSRYLILFLGAMWTVDHSCLDR
jgi:hypothetical protein